MLMNNGARCRVSREFGVLWCDPPRGCIGPPWWTIVFLHGRGEGGDGSPEELPRIVGGAGLPFEIARRDNQLLQDPELFPFLVVAPQTAVRWEQEHARVDRVIRDLRESGFVRGRPLLTGFSIGGDGAWAIATKDPSAFAGITPIAGEDPQPTQHIASALAQLPIWIGYRNDDYSSRRRPSVVIDALAKAGNTNVEVRDYYPGSTPDGLSPHTCAAHQAYTDSRFHAWLRDRCH
jgi:predicted peptidase